MNKEKLIEHYVNLYRILWNGNGGLWTEDLERMKESELRKEIKQMKQEIKDKNPYFPGFEKAGNVMRVCKRCKSEIHLTRDEADMVGLTCPNCGKGLQ